MQMTTPTITYIKKAGSRSHDPPLTVENALPLRNLVRFAFDWQ